MRIVANVDDDLANVHDDLANVHDNLANVDDDLANVDDVFTNVDDDFADFDSKVGVNREPCSSVRSSQRRWITVSSADLRPAFRKDASNSRRAGLRSRASDPDRRRSWTRPFRRTRRAIACSLRLINSSCRVFEAAERFAQGRPVRAVRQLEVLSDWAIEAAEQLDQAARGLRQTADRAAQSPDVALDAPQRLFEATAQWIAAAAQLAAFSARLDDTSAWLFDSVESGAIPIPLQEQTADAGKTRATIPLIARPLVAPHWLSDESDDVPCIPVRRRRSKCLTVAEAARRIFRGRAPPLVSTCSL